MFTSLSLADITVDPELTALIDKNYQIRLPKFLPNKLLFNGLNKVLVKMALSLVPSWVPVPDEIFRILQGCYHHFGAVKMCMQSDCESWVLKTETIATRLAYVLGFTSPNRLIMHFLKNRIQNVSTNLTTFIDDNPHFEFILRILLSSMEQLALDHAWDLVRETSVCMTYNDCDNDFMGQMNNIKIKV